MLQFKKVISLIIALSMSLTLLLSGCGNKKDDQASTASNPSAVETKAAGAAEPAPITEYPETFPKIPKAVDPGVYSYDDMSKKYDFEIMLPGSFNQPIDEDPIKKYMDQKFNVNVKFSSLKGEDLRTTVAVRYSSGDAPDVVKMNYKEVASSLYEQGNLVDGDKVLPYMPQLAQYVTKDYKEYSTVDGKMIGIPRYPTFGDNWWYFIRQDWLDQFGMKMPANEDELLAYARACVEKDPNKNGKADTWFMGGAGGGTGFGMIDDFRSMFGHPGFNVADNKINHPMIDGSTKAFLQFVNKLYTEKLLAPDWYTTDWEKFKSYSMNDQIGMVRYPGWNLVDETYNAHKKDAGSIKVWQPVGYLKSNDGKGGMLSPGGTPDGLLIFKKDLEKDMGKLKRIAHFLDTCMYPNENYWAVSQGGGPEIYPDGSRVTKNEDGTNVFFINKDVHPAYTDQKNISLADWQFLGYTLIWQIYDDEPVGVLGSKFNMDVIGMQRYKNYEMLITLNPDTQNKLREFTQRNEIAFVMGKRSFTEWDKYVTEWKNAGGQSELDEAAKQLNVSK